MPHATQQETLGAIQGVTQDASQHAEENRPAATGHPEAAAASTPAGSTSPAPVEPGEPKDPGGTGDPVEPPQPQVLPSSTPDGPQTIPAPATPEGEPGPDAQLENAGTSLGESSDDGGSEGVSR
jgi:hypothetical protein